MNEKLQKYEEKMESALKHLNKELASIRAGRANPAILDKVLSTTTSPRIIRKSGPDASIG